VNLCVIIPTFKEMAPSGVISTYLINTLQGWLNQDLRGHSVDVVISDNISHKSFDRTVRQFCIRHNRDNLKFHYISNKNHCPTFVSFNLGIHLLRHKLYDYYIYCSDDTVLTLSSDLNISLKTFKEFPRSALVSVLVNSDNAAECYPKNKVQGDGTSIKIKLGESTNLHFFIFSRYWMEKYDFKYPDVVSAYGTESFLSYLCEAIDREWVLCRSLVLDNQKRLKRKLRKTHGITGYSTYNAFKTFDQIFARGTQFGLGFEVWKSEYRKHRNAKPPYYVPDVDSYDEYGRCKDRPSLYMYIKNNLFLPKNVLDYDSLLQNSSTPPIF